MMKRNCEAYEPDYKKVYKAFMNWKTDSVNIPEEELEMMYIVQGQNFQIFKFLPYKRHDGISEDVWCNYFLDLVFSGEIKPRIYWDEFCSKGFKALNKEKSWFLKMEIWDHIKTDQYVKIRRIQYKECKNLEKKSYCGWDIYDNKCYATKEQRETCLKKPEVV